MGIENAQDCRMLTSDYTNRVHRVQRDCVR